MTGRTLRLLLPLTLLAGLLVPGAADAGGWAADTDDPCALSEDGPAYLCSGVSNYRHATAYVVGRGYAVGIYAFEGFGPSLPSGTTRTTGGCVLIETRRAYSETCGLALDVIVDPLLETATITGTVRDRRFGVIVVDVTIDADGDVSAYPGWGALVAGGCMDGTLGTGGGTLQRGGEGSGSVRIGRTRLNAAGSPGMLGEGAGAGGFAKLEMPCAEERASGGPMWFVIKCTGFFAGPAAAESCNTSSQVRQVSVSAKNAKARLRVVATEVTDSMPSEPDPTWIEPEYLVPGSYTFACLILSGRGFGLGLCGGELEAEIDPLLRTAHIKGEFRSPYDRFGPEFPRAIGMPTEFDFGRVYVDLTIAADENGPRPIGRNETWAIAGCFGTFAIQEAAVMQADGNATGYVVFKKRHGSFRGGAAKALPATLDWSALSYSESGAWPSTCPDDY